jgi:hypothetical protein
MNNLQRQSILSIVLTLNLQVVNPVMALPTFDGGFQLASATPGFPDKLISSKTVVGYFKNFVWGDYFYAVIRTNRGNMTFLIDLDEDCFLAYHQQAKLKIRYERLQRYLPQTGGYQSIDVISNIQTDRTNLVKWRRSISPSKLKQCRRLIERATKSS